MGYYVNCRSKNTTFRIPRSNLADALLQINDELDTDYDSVEEALQKDGWWRTKIDWGDGSGDLVITGLRRSKIGGARPVIRAAAPYVEPGTHIEMYGEDGNLWRYVFDGEKMHEVEPEIIWPDP